VGEARKNTQKMANINPLKKKVEQFKICLQQVARIMTSFTFELSIVRVCLSYVKVPVPDAAM
jgi:hypothetical protein